MTWEQKYLDNLKEISSLIDSDKFDEALKKFIVYIKDLKIGRYSAENWKIEWRNEVYSFGRKFINKDAGPLINALELYLKESPENTEEVEFIYSEILWNYFDEGTDYIGSTIKSLKNKYSTNPEFHHTYSHYLEKNNNFDSAIQEAFLAYKMDQNNYEFKSNYFNKCKKYFDLLLSKRDIERAKEVLVKMRRTITNPNTDFVFNNIIISLSDRVSDHEVINTKINSISDIAREIIAKERNKIIEILGFFAAILSFVFININIALSSLPFRQILLLMVGMALVLGFFALLISILSSKTYDLKWSRFYKDIRIMILGILILLFYLLMKYSS